MKIINQEHSIEQMVDYNGYAISIHFSKSREEQWKYDGFFINNTDDEDRIAQDIKLKEMIDKHAEEVLKGL